jgi:hypothetical protein
MGNYIDCCRKPYTVQYGADIPIGHCDTNINDQDLQNSPKKKLENYDFNNPCYNLNNQTVRRNSLFSPKIKDFNNLGTELNDLNSNVKYKDEFMKNFTLMLKSTYGSVYNSLFYENEFEINYETVQNFIEKNKDSIPLLNVFIYNTNDLEKNCNFDDEETVKNQSKAKKILNLNPFGLYGNNLSLREKNDGITIFGISKSNNEIEKLDLEKLQVPIDYVLELNYIEYEEILNIDKNQFSKDSKNSDFIPIFAVKFDLHSLRYYIKDLFSGISTIYKVKNETVLKNNSLITIGESYILITFGEMSNPGLLQTTQVGNNYNSHNSKDNSELINIKVFNKNGQLIHDPMYVKLDIRNKIYYIRFLIFCFFDLKK